jgi:hypothetical protein
MEVHAMSCATAVLAAFLLLQTPGTSLAGVGVPPKGPAIDQDYFPRVGDRAVLGGPPLGERKKISHAFCFSRVEGVQSYLDELKPDEGDPFADRWPDIYLPRIGTPVIVRELRTVRVRDGGETIPIAVARVQVLEGEFSNRTLFTAAVNVIRFNSDEGGRAVPDDQGRPRAVVKKRSSRRTAPAPGQANAKIILSDLAVNPSPVTKMVAISGRFRNISDVPLKGIMVSIVVENRAGKMLRSTSWFCQPSTIDPGNVGTFETILEDDPEATQVKLDFKDLERAIPWIDRSGKDAHQ